MEIFVAYKSRLDILPPLSAKIASGCPMSIRMLLSILLLGLMPGLAIAAIDTFEFTNQEQQERYQQFIEEMRCPKCDNQSLSGSNSAISLDLRKQLYDMVSDNKTDDEIITYMVDRYGDFILYKPRLTRSTLFLWGAPILFLMIGALILIFLVKSKKNTLANQNFSASERAELDRLLEEYAKASNTQNNTEVK